MADDAGGGRVAIVTGGATGVGAATALSLAGRGYRVAVNYSRSAADAEATAHLCREAGRDAVAIRCDVAQDADCRAMVADVAGRWGRIDALVNNAGATQFTRLGNFDDQNAEDFQRVYAVNVIGAYQMARAAAPWLTAGDRPVIVNVSSIAGLNGNGSSLAYVTSKGALNTLTMALARVFAPKVRVNAVLPGFIDTRWFTDGVGAETAARVKANFVQAAAMEDFCTAEDIAAGVVFLVDDALKMTGQFLTIDAGFLLGRAAKASR